MSRFIVTMPRLGESVTEGSIVRWFVGPGDHVDEFDPLVEICTDKVETEIPAPVTGTVVEIVAEEGADIPVGGTIAVIEVPSEGVGQSLRSNEARDVTN